MQQDARDDPPFEPTEEDQSTNSLERKPTKIIIPRRKSQIGSIHPVQVSYAWMARITLATNRRSG